MKIPISIVVRTFNSSRTLAKVFSKLSLRPGDEIIVVDSGSRDDTLAIAKNAGARIVDLGHKKFSYGGSLNAGFSEAKNDWILALSSHCIPMQTDLLDPYRQLLPALQPEIACITGGIYGYAGQIKKTSGTDICTPADFARGVFFTCSNPNALYRKTAWAQRPFDEQMDTGEDMDWSVWALKNGYSLMRNHAAIVLYRSQLGPVGMMKKGYIEARAAKKIIADPPITVIHLLGENFWNFAAIFRKRAHIGYIFRRTFYFLGYFWGNRTT